MLFLHSKTPLSTVLWLIWEWVLQVKPFTPTKLWFFISNLWSVKKCTWGKGVFPTSHDPLHLLWNYGCTSFWTLRPSRINRPQIGFVTVVRRPLTNLYVIRKIYICNSDTCVHHYGFPCSPLSGKNGPNVLAICGREPVIAVCTVDSHCVASGRLINYCKPPSAWNSRT